MAQAIDARGASVKHSSPSAPVTSKGRIVRKAWFGSCFASQAMSSQGLRRSGAVDRRISNTKSHIRREQSTSATEAAPAPQESPSRRTLARTKALLLAALRVWELKQRIKD